MRERKQYTTRLSRDCLGNGRTTKSRSTCSSRRRVSRDRWSSSALGALCSNSSVIGMVVLRLRDTLARAKAP